MSSRPDTEASQLLSSALQRVLRDGQSRTLGLRSMAMSGSATTSYRARIVLAFDRLNAGFWGDSLALARLARQLRCSQHESEPTFDQALVLLERLVAAVYGSPSPLERHECCCGYGVELHGASSGAFADHIRETIRMLDMLAHGLSGVASSTSAPPAFSGNDQLRFCTCPIQAASLLELGRPRLAMEALEACSASTCRPARYIDALASLTYSAAAELAGLSRLAQRGRSRLEGSHSRQFQRALPRTAEHGVSVLSPQAKSAGEHSVSRLPLEWLLVVTDAEWAAVMRVLSRPDATGRTINFQKLTASERVLVSRARHKLHADSFAKLVSLLNDLGIGPVTPPADEHTAGMA